MGPTAHPQPAPATAPRPHWTRELLWHAIALALTGLFLTLGLRLDRADLGTPFTYELDALLILPMVKGTVETGTHWRNDRLGAPGVQELHDFPVVDHLHFAVIWLLGQVFPNPVVVFNLFHLLTYPLVTVTALLVLRHFGLSPPAAICGALLYAFQPYHHQRGQMHYFLAAYYVVPLTLMVILWVCRGRLPFFREADPGRYQFTFRSRDTWVAILIAALTASAGAYYAFFACALFVMAGVYAWITLRTWKGAASAALVTAAIVVGGLLNHAPAFPYQYEYGRNARVTARPAEDAELYGMRIIQLVFPVAQHNPVGIGETIWFDPAALRSMYQAPHIKELNESDWDALGLVGSLGYVSLLLLALVPVRRTWPLGPLTALTLFATLFATTGGFGAVFNYLITAQIRCHNRMSIYLAFLALFAACWFVDRALARRRAWLRWLAFGGLILFGIWDQTDDKWFPDARPKKDDYVSVEKAREKVAKVYWEDRAFFERVEEILPEGMVFYYPHMEYPESRPYFETGSPGAVESYEPVLGYLHTRNLRWSFGSMKYRECDTWSREVCGMVEAYPRFIDRLIMAGFTGLIIDARGIHPFKFHKLKNGIETDGGLGQGAFREFHPTRKLYFYDLREKRNTLRANFGKTWFDAQARAELDRVYVLWLAGFASFEELGYEIRRYWCPKRGLWVFVNNTGATVTRTVRMTLKTTFKGQATVTIQGGDVWSDEIAISQNGTPYERTLTIPPGRHSIRVRCDTPVSVLPLDSRNDLFAVLDFKLDPPR